MAAGGKRPAAQHSLGGQPEAAAHSVPLEPPPWRRPSRLDRTCKKKEAAGRFRLCTSLEPRPLFPRPKRAKKLPPPASLSSPGGSAGCLLKGTVYFCFKRRPGRVDDRSPGLQHDFAAIRQLREVSPDCFSKASLDTIADNSIPYCSTDGQSCLAGLPCFCLSENGGKKGARPKDAIAVDSLEFRSAAEAPGFGETCRTRRNRLRRLISRS